MSVTGLWVAAVLAVGPTQEKTVVVPLPAHRQLELLGTEEGRRAIVESVHDPFFRTIGQLDIELRLAEPLEGVPRERQLQQLHKLFVDSVRDWTPSEVQALAEACRVIDQRAGRLAPAFLPRRWRFIKTDGSEEAGAAYTRHDAIILPQSKVKVAVNNDRQLQRLLAHETAHVFSRLHPELSSRLYARLGFRRVGPIELGDYLSRRRLTNPDGPALEHVIRVETAATGPFDAVLVTYAKTDRFAPEHGRRLFDYLRFGLFAVEPAAGGLRIKPGPDGRPIAFTPEQVTQFYEQIGRNTRYVIHPDEILADNLAILMTDGIAERNPADAQLLRDLAAILNGGVSEKTI